MKAPPKDLTENQLKRWHSNRTRLLLAAGDAFSRIGYANAAVADIVKTAGMSSRSFYEFFDSREDILISLLETSSENMFALVDRKLQGHADPIDRIEIFLSTMLQLASLFPMIGYQVMAAGEGPRMLRMRAGEKLGEYLAAEVNTAFKQGKFTRSADPVTVKLIVGGIDSLILAYHSEGRREKIPEAIPAALEFVIRAFR